MNEEKTINEQELEKATGGFQGPDVVSVMFECPICGRQFSLAMGVGTAAPTPPICCGQEVRFMGSRSGPTPTMR